MKKIKIVIAKDGSQRLEVLGAAGDECIAFTRDLERRLGVPSSVRVLKPVFEEGDRGTEAQRESERGR